MSRLGVVKFGQSRYRGLPVPPAEWEYDPFGKRVQSPGANGAVRVSLYSLAGQVLYQMDCPTEQYNSGCVPVQSFQYFGSKLLKTTDRLGSVRVTQDTTWPYAWQEPSYYPYGEEENNPQPGGTIKFATYLRDGQGLDYAMNRYYSSVLGRFHTPDPGGIRTSDPKKPGSWNRYMYTNDDPVNRHDPTGLCGEDEDDFDDRCMDNDGSGGGGADLFAARAGECDSWGDAFALVPRLFCAMPVGLPVGKGPSIHVTLTEIDDCIFPRGTRTSAGFTLEVEYQVLDNGQQVLGKYALNNLGISIAESVTKTSGNIDYTSGVWCPDGGACGTAGSMSSSGTFWDDLAGQGTAIQSFLFHGVVVPVTFPGASGASGTQTKLNNIYNSKGRSISVGDGAVIGNPKTRPCDKAGDPAP